MEDTLEQIDKPQGEVPQAVKTMAIFAYIGNGFWAIMLIILILMVFTALDTIERIVGQSLGEAAGVVALTMVFMLATCILSIIGAYKMTKGQKSGFWMYAIGNGIWVLLFILAQTTQNTVFAVISLGFIIGFGTQLKNLR